MARPVDVLADYCGTLIDNDSTVEQILERARVKARDLGVRCEIDVTLHGITIILPEAADPLLFEGEGA